MSYFRHEINFTDLFPVWSTASEVIGLILGEFARALNSISRVGSQAARDVNLAISRCYGFKFKSTQSAATMVKIFGKIRKYQSSSKSSHEAVLLILFFIVVHIIYPSVLIQFSSLAWAN